MLHTFIILLAFLLYTLEAGYIANGEDEVHHDANQANHPTKSKNDLVLRFLARRKTGDKGKGREKKPAGEKDAHSDILQTLLSKKKGKQGSTDSTNVDTKETAQDNTQTHVKDLVVDKPADKKGKLGKVESTVASPGINTPKHAEDNHLKVENLKEPSQKSHSAPEGESSGHPAAPSKSSEVNQLLNELRAKRNQTRIAERSSHGFQLQPPPLSSAESLREPSFDSFAKPEINYLPVKTRDLPSPSFISPPASSSSDLSAGNSFDWKQYDLNRGQSNKENYSPSYSDLSQYDNPSKTSSNTWMGSDQGTSPDRSRNDGCNVGGRLLAVGDTWTTKGICGWFTCQQNQFRVITAKCPTIRYQEGSRCDVFDQDLTQDFPHCCPTLVCYSGDLGPEKEQNSTSSDKLELTYK